MTSVPGTARLLAANTLWKGAGVRSAGRKLVDALGSEDEDTRTMAGMLLVRGGKRATPLIREAIQRREHLPIVLTIAGDLADPALRPRIEPFVDDPDPEVAKAAREALELIGEAGRKRS